jgi:hypothetical protein
MYFTGSKEHNIELRKLAIEKGWSLNEYGLTKGEKVVAARTEEDVYKALGLAWVPPELREMHGEIDMARDGTLPKLIELSDLRADLHMHTTRTDGRDSIDAMVEGAIARGHEYIAITEHSKAIAMAFGFDAERVRKSIGEIEAARERHPDIHILHGLEVDILADGELDLDDETLALLDWVIISIHSRFEQTPDVATARALRAVSHPLVHAFGHPTGRAIGSRDSVAVRRGEGLRGGRGARCGDGDQRLARATGPLRRERPARAVEGMPVRDRHGCARRRAVGPAPVRRLPGAARRAHEGRRVEHAAVRAVPRRAARAAGTHRRAGGRENGGQGGAAATRPAAKQSAKAVAKPAMPVTATRTATKPAAKASGRASAKAAAKSTPGPKKRATRG